MGAMTSQIISFTIVYSTVYSGANQRKQQSPCHWPWCVCGEFTIDPECPAQRASNTEMFPFDDVTMYDLPTAYEELWLREWLWYHVVQSKSRWRSLHCDPSAILSIITFICVNSWRSESNGQILAKDAFLKIASILFFFSAIDDGDLWLV